MHLSSSAKLLFHSSNLCEQGTVRKRHPLKPKLDLYGIIAEIIVALKDLHILLDRFEIVPRKCKIVAGDSADASL
jgi:hypothetical protein